MIYVWAAHSESKKKAVALLAIQDYALAETKDVASLLAASQGGTSVNLHENWYADDLRQLPGCRRLDYTENFSRFTAN